MPVMDTLIYHDLGYKSAQKDIIEYKTQITSKNEQISFLKANESDLKEQIKNHKILVDNYKITAGQFQDKYSKEKNKSNFRGKILIGSLSVNVLLITSMFFMLK